MKIFSNDVFVMENTIKLTLNSSSGFHNTLVRLEDEIAMNWVKMYHILENHLNGCIYDGKHHQQENEIIVPLPQNCSSARGWESDESHLTRDGSS